MCAAGAVLPLVIASRALVGLGEGVTMPSMNNLLAKHVPPASRARSIGLIFSGFHAGARSAPPRRTQALPTVQVWGLFLNSVQSTRLLVNG